VEKRSLVPSFPHKVLQKWLKNFVSLSLIMVLGRPLSLTTSLKKRLAICVASSTLWHGIKWAILENLSTTTDEGLTPTSVPMYLWSPLFLAHFSHFLETYETHSLSPFVLERN